jgi:NDP-sugar pyrophosphorylase family protein
MVPVNNKPFLLYLLEFLKTQGIDDVVLCLGYLREQVQNFFATGCQLGIKIRYSEEKERLLGTGGALKQAQNLFWERFFVINGDTYLPLNYKEVERTFLACDKKALLVVYDNKRNTGVKNNVELDNKLMVIRYDKQSSDPGLKYVDAGVLVLKREAIDLIKAGKPISLEKEIYPILIEQREMAAYITKQRFYDIGTPEQLEVFETYLTREQK